MKFYFSKFDRNCKLNDQEVQQTPNTHTNVANYTKAHHNQIILKWYKEKNLKKSQKKRDMLLRVTKVRGTTADFSL